MERLNKRGEAWKPLVVKQLELEYWRYVTRIQEASHMCTIADAIRIALKHSAETLNGSPK